VQAVLAMRRRSKHSACSGYYYKKCSGLGEINCTAGWVVIWFEMGGLEGLDGGEGLTGGKGVCRGRCRDGGDTASGCLVSLDKKGLAQSSELI
jgi:hypothetical protein